MSEMHFDYETFSEVEFGGTKSEGLFNYCDHPSSQPLTVSWVIDEQQLQFAEINPYTKKLPKDFEEALRDPHVRKWAFNASFERMFTERCLGIATPYESWRCVMVAAYHFSFSGGLGDVGAQIGLPLDKQKDTDGKRLIKVFCTPQKVTKKQPYARRNGYTDAEDWDRFCEYNRQDVIAEVAIARKLPLQHMPEIEWELYALDQQINDRGMPVNLTFCKHALALRDRRLGELVSTMRDMTHLQNPNSRDQLLPWLKERGYRFNDLQKGTIKKELAENEEGAEFSLPFKRKEIRKEWLEPEAVAVLNLRRHASRISPTKYAALTRLSNLDGRLCHSYQMGAASRTNRWAGRGFNAQNLTRTPKAFEPKKENIAKFNAVNQAIQDNDYDWLKILVGEPMDALAGMVRSAFQTPEGKQFTVCDLSSIESAVIGWLCQCTRLLGVFSDGRDPYRDFGTELFRKEYHEVTPEERTDSKPAVLGSGYGLGGGDLDKEGKKTGLWGYAENMGIKISKELAHKATALFRNVYHEIPQTWAKLDAAARDCINLKKTVDVNGIVQFKMIGEYMTIRLPSGRRLWYYRPAMRPIKRVFKDKVSGEERVTEKLTFTYMGNLKDSKKWARITSWGGKLIENIVQAIARDILVVGLLRAHAMGFEIVGHVHDEIISLEDVLNGLTLKQLQECMASAIDWANGCPLGAAGYTATVYRKD